MRLRVSWTSSPTPAELSYCSRDDGPAVLVETDTSTGFINTWGAASFEYLLDGDTAIASMAYSDLPSAFGLLTAGVRTRQLPGVPCWIWSGPDLQSACDATAQGVRERRVVGRVWK